MQHLIISALLLCSSLQLCAQKSVIIGKAIDYSTKEITFYTIPDPVLRQKKELATTKVASDGTFTIALPIHQTIEIYADLEKYCGTMVVEPGKNYTITLPPFSLRNSAEAHSSYFKPAPYWFGIPGAAHDDINFAVRSFVTDFNLETFKNTYQVYQKQSKEVVNEIIERLEQKYSNNKNDYFQTLKNYYFAELEYAVNQRTPELIVQKYFATKPLRLHHPIYQRAFETIFTDFLRIQSQDIQNRKLINMTNSGNYLELVSFFEKRGYSKDFAELVVLKGLNDGYYTGSFSKQGVTKAIEQAQTVTITPELQPLVHQIKIKLTQLAVGGKAPAIKLSNQRKQTVTLDQFSGKYVYLSFFKSNSSDCKAELDSIVLLEKKFRQVLNVVSVALDDDFNNAVNLWKTKGYLWELLNGSNQKQLITSYNASVAPAFYLIAPDGTLLLSPASSPSYGFEPQFLKVLRESRFK